MHEQFFTKSHGNNDPILLATLIATILSSLIMSILSYNRFALKNISIESDTLLIPRVFLKDYCIELKQIGMLDIFGKPNCSKTAIISRKAQSPLAVSEELFMCRAHFDEFISLMNQKLENVQETRRSNPGSSASFGSMSMHTVPIILALITTFSFIIFSKEFESIDPIALEIGGLTKDALSSTQAYRLFTSPILHHTLPHLALNLVSLGIFARPTEVIIGRNRIINVILISALAGSLFSLFFSPYEIVAGASGGILGLIGAYSALHFKYKNKLIGSAFIPQNALLLTLLIQILSDIFLSNVDIFSHLFGFLAGATYIIYTCRSCSIEEASRHSHIEQLYSSILSTAFLCSLIYLITQYFKN